jgi:hypothetical protein
MQVCAFKISVLRKAITRMRKQMRITGPKGSVALKELLLQHGGVQETEGSVSALRKRWTAVSKREHPPVSKMSTQAVIKYLYKTAAAPFDWDWTTVITDGEKVRISKRCRKAPGTGQVAEAPAGALPKPKKAVDDLDVPRELTSYQKHTSDTIRELKSSNPGMSAKDRFKEAVRLWNRSKNITKTRAEIERGRQARKRRDAENPMDAAQRTYLTKLVQLSKKVYAKQEQPAQLLAGWLEEATALGEELTAMAAGESIDEMLVGFMTMDPTMRSGGLQGMQAALEEA